MSIYAAILDGGVYAIRQSIQAAEEDAAWLRRNPARIDRVRFGNGGDVYVAELIEDEFGVDDYVVVGGSRDGAIVNGCPAWRPR